MRLGTKGKKALAYGKKGLAIAGAVGGLVGMGVKTHHEVQEARKDIRETNRATLMASFNENPQIKPMKEGTEVIGVRQGSGSVGHNIYGAGIQAGRGVEAARSAPRARTLPPPAPPLPPVNIKKEGARAVAGLVGGNLSAGAAVKDVASAAFENLGGSRNRPDARQEAISAAGRGARAGASVAAGAENINPTLRDVGRVAKSKAKKKVKKLNPLSRRG